jgi:Na+/melibiose symporter-like transporter
MTVDTELESLRQSWRRDTEPLPELKRRIRRQNRRMAWGVALLALVLIAATVMAVLHPDSFWRGFLVGVAIAILVGGGYAWWVRRETWAPAAETTQAFLELLHKRAVADLRKLRFLRHFLLVTLVLLAAFEIWRGYTITTRTALIFAAMALEWIFLMALERRKARAVESTRDATSEP